MQRVRVDTSDQAARIQSTIVDLLANGPLMVTIEPYKPPAKEKQKLKMFAMVGEIANELGYEREELRQIVKQKYGPKVAVQMRNGGVVEYPKSMSKYSREEASAMIERLFQLAAETNVGLSQ